MATALHAAEYAILFAVPAITVDLLYHLVKVLTYTTVPGRLIPARKVFVGKTPK